MSDAARAEGGKVKLIQGVCPFCGAGCGFYLVVRDGQILGIERIFDHPVSAGVLCPKGIYSWKVVNHPDRLRKPLLRTESGFKEIEWGEAIRILTERFKEAKAAGDPNRMYFLSSARCTNEENYLMQKLARAVAGTNNVDHCARLCHSPTVAALRSALGSAAMTNPINDVVNAKTLFIIGYNPAETHPAITRLISEARQRHAVAARVAIARFGFRRGGFKMIVADPRKTMTALEADIHLRHRPGTDAWLLNAMAKIIIDNDLIDKEFIETRTKGFEDLVKSLEDFDLEKAARITGVPLRDIEEAAITYATNKPSTIYYGMGITQHVNGTELVHAIANLALITGNIGKPGAGICPARGQANVQGACDMGALPDVFPGYASVEDTEAIAKFERAWGVLLPRERGMFSPVMWERALEGKIDFLYIMGENPVLAEPSTDTIVKAMERIGFVVVQDIFMTETAEHADLVLPAASWFEKTGTVTNTERRVQLIYKVAEPPGDAKPDLDILIKVMKELGFNAPYAGPEDVFNEIRSLVPTYRGITYERIRKSRYGIQWPCPSEDHPGTPILHVNRFPTKDGRAWIRPIPPRTTVEPTKEYPLILTTGRSMTHYNTGTVTRRIMELTLKQRSSLLHISPEDAAKYDVKDGEKVLLKTPYSIPTPIRVKITPEVPPGVVFIHNHFTDPPANTFTTGKHLDPESGIPEYKATPAKIIKWPE